ncbi:hypothetical protein ACFXTN_037351 [Malus domestica]
MRNSSVEFKFDNVAGIIVAVDSFPYATLLLLVFASPGREATVIIHEASFDSKKCFPFSLYAPDHLGHLSNIPVANYSRRNIIEIKG